LPGHVEISQPSSAEAFELIYEIATAWLNNADLDSVDQ